MDIEFDADAILTNELIDAFAPVKLKMSVFDLQNIDPGSCSSWTEMRLLHLIKKSDLLNIFGPQVGLPDPTKVIAQLEDFTTTFFCTAAKTSIGEIASMLLPRNTTCLNMILGLSELMENADLQIPAASHNVRLRLKKDVLVQDRLRKIVKRMEYEHKDQVVIPRHMYKQLRKGIKDNTHPEMNIDVNFMI